MRDPKWTSEENVFLMQHAMKEPWADIAHSIGRTEQACRVHYAKIVSLRKSTGTWRPPEPRR